MRRFFHILVLAAAGLAPSALVPPAQAASDTPAIAPMALNSYCWAPPRIVTAPVTDLQNDMIGRVARLDLAGTGKPEGIEIYLTASGRVIGVPSSNISYDEQKNVLTAGLDRAQVQQQVQQPPPPARR